MSHAEIVSQFREHIRVVKQIPLVHGNPAANRLVNAERKVIAVIDSIASNPGVRMPWQEMVQVCKDEGVWSIIDAAHSLGHEVGINLNKTDPDFWVSVRAFSIPWLRIFLGDPERGDRLVTNGSTRSVRQPFCMFQSGQRRSVLFSDVAVLIRICSRG